jgi:hypothetical protein
LQNSKHNTMAKHAFDKFVQKEPTGAKKKELIKQEKHLGVRKKKSALVAKPAQKAPKLLTGERKPKAGKKGN